MHCKDLYLEYLIDLSEKKFPLTIKTNEQERLMLVNHRSVSGISEKNKKLCFTVIASTMQGPTITDIDGNQYVDLTMGFGVNLFGHHPDFIVEGIRKRNEMTWGLGPLNIETFELAQHIVKLTGVERIACFNSGTEAIMVAMRIARAQSKKKKIVVFKASYHGHNDSTLVFKTDPMTQMPVASIPGIADSLQSDTFLLDYDDISSLSFIEEHAGEIAGVLVEPVQSRNPGLQPRAFLEGLRRVTAEKGIALIFDEIITGFRIHQGGAQRYFNIHADIVTYGKIIGGGMPIGIVAGKGEYLDLIDGGLWQYHDDSLPLTRKTFVAGTFCQHPLTIAAANVVAKKMIDCGNAIQENLNNTTHQMIAEVNLWMELQNIPIHLEGFGSLFKIQIPPAAKLFFNHLLLEGIYVWEGKTCFLSTAHAPAHIGKIKKTIQKCALALVAAGYFHRENRNAIHAPANIQSSAFNIGVSLRIEGIIMLPWLDFAIRYVFVSLVKLSSIDPATVVKVKQFRSEDCSSDFLRTLMNENLSERGISCLLITNEAHVVNIAIAAHKNFIDGWSISILLDRIMETYNAFVSSSPLPDISDGDFNNSFPETSQFSSSVRISRMRKRTVLVPLHYIDIKKRVRKFNRRVLDLFEGAFIISYQRHFPTNDRLVVATPIARHIQAARNDFGSYTTLKKRTYVLNQHDSLEQLLLHTAEEATHEPSCILNMDRVISHNRNTVKYKLTATPLDPEYIRYDLVVNVLTGREDGILIDFKWREDEFPEDKIDQFIHTFEQLIRD